MPSRRSLPTRAPTDPQAAGPLACRPTPVAVAIRSALLMCVMSGALVVALPGQARAQSATATPAAASKRTYTIPAGSLDQVLNRFAGEAGVELSVDSKLTQGKTSSGLSGSYTVTEGFEQIARGQGLQVVRADNGTYSLRVASTATRDEGYLPAVKVKSTTDSEVDQVNPPTTVGSKIPLTQREIPQSVNVVTQEQIQQQGFTSLNELMTYVPGVQALYTTADRMQYYSRGFPLNSYQIDGLPVFTNSNVSATANTQTPNLAMYDRVEVLTGPAGLLDGMGDAGGVVNLVRKHAPSQFTASGEIAGGSYDNRLGEFDLGGPLNQSGTVRGLIVGSYQDQDLPQDTTWQRNKLIYGTLDIDLTPSTLLRLGANYSDQAAHISWFNGPVSLSNGKFYIPSQSQYFGTDWDRDTSSNSDLFAELQHKWSNGWLLRAAVDYQVDKYTYNTTYLNGGVDPTTFAGSLTALYIPAYEHNRSFEISASGPVTIFGMNGNMTFGADYTKMIYWNKQFYDQPYPNDYPFNIPIDSIFDTNIPKPVWTGALDNTDVDHEYASQYGVYGNARINITDPLTLIVGARVSWLSDKQVPDAIYNADQYVPQTLADYHARVTPYAGLVYDLNKTYSAYASYTSIFTPQYGAIDPNGQGLPPVVGNQFELGVKGEYFNGLLNASAAVYQITETNTAIPDPAAPDSAFEVAQGKARDRGFEIKASGRLTQNWDISGGYIYNLARLVNGDALSPASSPFTETTPRNQFTLWTNYRLSEYIPKLQIGGGVVATSGTTGGSFHQGGYYVASARVAYQLTPKVSLALNVNNLFDKNYYQNGLYRGLPREALVTLRAAY